MDIYNNFREFKAFDLFFDLEGEQKMVSCNIRCIEKDTLVVDSNNEDNENIQIPKNTKVRLLIYTNDGLYSAYSTILEVNSGTINTEYIISRPKENIRSQRREYYRAEMPIQANIEITDIVSGENFTLTGKTKNISGKGIAIISDIPLYDSKSYIIKTTLYFEDKTIITDANLVYSKKYESLSKTRYIQAFSFPNISEKAMDYILKKCFLYQLEMRKNLL